MKTRRAWLLVVGVLFALAWLMSSAITWHPSAVREGVVAQIVTGAGAVACFILALVLKK